MWIKQNLEPYDKLSINYVRLYVPGLDAHTSTNAEVSHKSIKYGSHSVNSSMQTYTSCNKQATKAEVRAHEMAKEIAQKACKNIIQKDSETREYLTPWAENKTLIQRSQMNDYWIVQVSNTKFYMMKPTCKEADALSKMNDNGLLIP